MEQQIQDLVDSIRKEGIEEAARQKEVILSSARQEAESILAKAKAEAAALVEDAKKECALQNESTRASLQQAARDLSLSLKEEIEGQLSKILSDGISSSLDSALVSKLVLAAVDAGLKDVDVEVSTADSEALVKELRKVLAGKLKDGLELKVAKGFTGIRLASQDKSGYIDLSANEIAALLKPYLSEAVKAQIFS